LSPDACDHRGMSTSADTRTPARKGTPVYKRKRRRIAAHVDPTFVKKALAGGC
jgi:hypothetical protein